MEGDVVRSNFVRLRGLPFSAIEDDVRAFLQGIKVEYIAFSLTVTGKATGECFVELKDSKVVDDVKMFNYRKMGGRYIEIFEVTNDEVQFLIQRGIIRRGRMLHSPIGYVVRLRGLPYTRTVREIKDFFCGLDVLDIVIDTSPDGVGFVQFASKQHAECALKMNGMTMGVRYIEMYRSSMADLKEAKAKVGAVSRFPKSKAYYTPPMTNQISFRDTVPFNQTRYESLEEQGPVRRNEGFGRTSYETFRERQSLMNGFNDNDDEDLLKVYMRGLPYNAQAISIAMFFHPLEFSTLMLGYNKYHIRTGDAYVIFPTTKDVHDALTRDRKYIGNRFIQLFTAYNTPTLKYVACWHNETSVAAASICYTPKLLNKAKSDSISKHLKNDCDGYRVGRGVLRSVRATW